jgi:HSP20 family protein
VAPFERYYGKFARSPAPADYVDAEKVEATCKEGVLYVMLAKKSGVKPKAISVHVK